MAFCRSLCSVGFSTFLFWIILINFCCCCCCFYFWKCKGGKITTTVRQTMNEEMTKSEEQHLSLQKALQQCELVQNMIDISISSLEGLRTKCATSNDLTQKEIRTLEVSTIWAEWLKFCCASSSKSIRKAVTVCYLFLGHCAFFFIAFSTINGNCCRRCRCTNMHRFATKLAAVLFCAVQ